jgi:hypothetical protein
MKNRLLCGALVCVFGLAMMVPCQQERRPDERPSAERDMRLPNGKSQQEEILKADHEKDLQDARQLVDLAEQLKVELEKNDRHVLSVSSIRKTEEIEKLVRKIRGRLRRY